MTTKEELHKSTKEKMYKLVDGLDIDSLLLKFRYMSLLMEILTDHQKQIEKTLEEKLIDYGFSLDMDCSYKFIKGKIHVILFDSKDYAVIHWTDGHLIPASLHPKKDDHDKIFEVIDFLTKWGE